MLSLANKVVHVARDFALDVIHAHYAIPHATAALLAQQVLASSGGASAPRVITTLHGTDITLVGSDPSFSEIVAYSIEQSDGVTAVSDSLRLATYAQLDVQARHRGHPQLPRLLASSPHRRPGLRERFAPEPGTKLVIHMSNFRPVKRIDAVVEVFERIAARCPHGCCSSATGPIWEPPTGAGRLGLTARRTWSASRRRSSRCCRWRTCSCCPRRRRASALRRSKRWRARCRWWPRLVGGIPEVIVHGVSGCPAPARRPRCHGRQRPRSLDGTPCAVTPWARPHAAESVSISASIESCRCTRHVLLRDGRGRWSARARLTIGCRAAAVEHRVQAQ